jgi:drug/metabolite transporter (DMT)-like permease
VDRLRTLAAVVTAATAFYAFTAIPLAQVYAILFAAPLLITVLAIPILGERVGIHRGLAVLVGLGGVIVVLQPTTTSLTPGHVAARRRPRSAARLPPSSCARSGARNAPS